MIDPKLLEFAAGPAQIAAVKAAIECGTISAAARKLGQNKSSVSKAIERARRHAALRGYSPEHGLNYAAPPTHILGRATIQRGPNGEIERTWDKLSLSDTARLQALSEAVEALKEDLPRAKPVAAPKRAPEDLCNVYVLTDFHLGALAWGEETRGEDWDSGIAEELLVTWFETAIAESPNAETGILAQLGDLLHTDNLDSVTPTSRHALDADTRYQRVVRIAIRLLRRVVAMMLEKHKQVVIVMAEGNHDIASSAWLREVFAAFYSDEPRVQVDTSPDPYYCYEHGLTSLFFHHGHLQKAFKGLDSTFAGKFREVFGRTRFSYAHTGHYHHIKAEETPLMVVQQHRTLAASDAYSSRSGYVSGRDAEVITYSKRFGKVGSITISPDRARHG